MSAAEKIIEELEAAGYIVIPPSDLPEVVVDEGELLATIKGLDRMDFSGGLIGMKQSIPSRQSIVGANHSVEYEYRRVVAHAAMAKWYAENLEKEERVARLRDELLVAEGFERPWMAPEKMLRKFTRQARALLRAQAQS